MMYFDGYELMEKIINMASEHFAPQFIVNTEKRSRLDNICKVIESMVSDITELYAEADANEDYDDQWLFELFNVEKPTVQTLLSYHINVSGETKNITFTLEIRDLIVENKPSNFSALLSNAKEVRFRPSDNSDMYMYMDLVFDGIWDEAV